MHTQKRERLVHKNELAPIITGLTVAGLATEGLARFSKSSAEHQRWEKWHYVVAVLLFIVTFAAHKQYLT
jgi:hypothetical protein